MDNKKVIIGGTFDFLHQGHKALLRKAFELGEVKIGVTSDMMARENKVREVESFGKRKNGIIDFVENELGKKTEVLEIDDVFGPTLKEDFDYIVVSPETEKSAFFINQERQKLGKNPMEVVKIDFVMAEDGEPISSTRIFQGEIDCEGKLIKK